MEILTEEEVRRYKRNFPEPGNLIDDLIHLECNKIINEGLEDPYTFKTLFKSPQKHTYEGLGKSFEEYNSKLKDQRKDITFWRFLLFYKWDSFMLFASCILTNIFEFMLTLLMQIFLEWVDDRESQLGKGVLILIAVLITYAGRFIAALQGDFYSYIFSPLTKNALEVSELT